MQLAFGTGFLICKRTDIAATPILLGVLQEVALDFDRKIETLHGQYNMAVAAGGGEFKIAGKAKFARFQAATFNNLFLGQTQSAGTMLQIATAESHSVVSGGFTVANSATFVEDLGAFYTSGGMALTSAVGAPASAGFYSAGANGQYSFNAGDNGAGVNVFDEYTTVGGATISLANQLMGPMPQFELNFKETFTVNGVAKDIVMRLNACVSSKLALPFSNQKFTIAQFDFQALADASNNIGTFAITEQ